jgi:hypothetical protein
MSDEHTTGDNDYEVTFHPAFASSCTVTDRKSGATKKLYEQDRSKPVDVRKNGHPKKHRIVLKGKNGKRRNITITVDDPEFAIHGITLELYAEGRDPSTTDDPEIAESFSVMNFAMTCPPHCKE